MVGKYDISEDKLTYTFTLRDGLKFHDGSPVTSKDVIASLKRWAARDGVGQRLFSFVDRLEAVDAKTFRMMLSKPYGMVLESLGKTGTSVAVIMREQEALTDPQQQIKEAIGSGPFKFAKDEWVPGSKTVYLKNPDYVPRPGSEKAAAFAGSKFAGVDRIELVWISDPQTAMSALVNGEIDFWENPNIDFLPILEKAKGVKLMKTGKFGTNAGLIRLNHLHPPFNNVKARQAMYHLINQEDFLRAIIGDPEYYHVCHGMITCGTPLASDAGSAMLKEYNPKKALQLMKEAGYNGEPITVLAATDHNTITPATQVLIQAMREAGLNSRRPVDGLGLGGVAPRQEGAAGAGRLEHLRHHDGHGRRQQPGAAHLDRRGLRQGRCSAGHATPRSRSCATTTRSRRPTRRRSKIARDLQARAIEQVVYIPFGQWDAPYAYRADRLEGIVPNTGLVVLWNITKK